MVAPLLSTLKRDAKTLGLKGYSTMRRDVLLEALRTYIMTSPAVVEKLKLLLKHKSGPNEEVAFTSGAQNCLAGFVCKLVTTAAVLPGYIGDAAAEYHGKGIFPDKIEYILTDVIDLAASRARDIAPTGSS